MFENLELYRDRIGRRVLSKDKKDAGSLGGNCY